MPEIRITPGELRPASPPDAAAPAPATPAPAVREQDTVRLPEKTPACTQHQSRGSHGQTSAQSAMVPPQASRAPAPTAHSPGAVPPGRDAELLRDNQETFAQLGIAETEQPQPQSEQSALPAYRDEDFLAWLRQTLPIVTYDQTMGLPMPYYSQEPLLEWQPAGREVDSSRTASLGLRAGLITRGVARSVLLAGLACAYLGATTLAGVSSRRGKAARELLDNELNINEVLVPNAFERAFSKKPNERRLKLSDEGRTVRKKLRAKLRKPDG